MPAEHAPKTDLGQWNPILQWLKPVLTPPPVAEARREPVLPARKPPVLGARPLHESGRLSVVGEPARTSVLGGLPLNEAARVALTGSGSR